MNNPINIQGKYDKMNLTRNKIDHLDKDGRTRLSRMISKSDGTLEKVKELIKKGADINATLGNGTTPLFNAMFYHKYEIFNYLIEKGADVNKSKYGVLGWVVRIYREMQTIIHNYVNRDPKYDITSRENKKIIELLLKKGADVNMSHPNLNITPFDDLLKYLPDKPSDDYISMIKLFIKKGTIISDAQLETMKQKLPSLINCAKKYKYIKSIN